MTTPHGHDPFEHPQNRSVDARRSTTGIIGDRATQNNYYFGGRLSPPWLAAIASVVAAVIALVVAIVWTGEHRSAPGVSASSGNDNSPVQTVPDHSPAPPGRSTTPSTSPAHSGPPAGTQLGTCHTTISPGYGLDIDSGCAKPATSGTDIWITGVVDPFGDERLAPGLWTHRPDTLALLDRGVAPSYQSCDSATAYETSILIDRDKSTVCYHGHGVMAAITVTATVSSAVLDYTVWAG